MSLTPLTNPDAVNFNRNKEYADVGSLVRSRTNPAIDLLRSGSEKAVQLSQAAQRQGTDPLNEFASLAAFNEQSALLGQQGQEAQQAAIIGIPVSQFDQELQKRQQQQLLRSAAATGDIGSGSTIAAGQQLAGGQQANVIQRRLAELEPLVAIARGVRSTQAGVDETSRARQAQLQLGLGAQESGVRFGAAAPIIESRLHQAELSGLSGIAKAQQEGQIAGQLANVAGRYAPQIGSYFSSPQLQTSPNPSFVTETNSFIPESGIVGVA